jgi:hypothetical protein
VLAGPKRSNQAKVAPEIANKGYCATKSPFYYGVKLHVIGSSRRISYIHQQNGQKKQISASK